MSSAELILLIQKNDKDARKQAFDTYFGRLAGISARYTKNSEQAEEILYLGFNNCLRKLQLERHLEEIDLGAFLEREFIMECISFIRNIRSEYYVASTVYAPGEAVNKNYNLFENNDALDYSRVDNEVLIRSLQQLVPSQRLIFNLHVVDGYSLEKAASMLESSEATVKSNLEKARFNLQKNIEKSLKSIKA